MSDSLLAFWLELSTFQRALRADPALARAFAAAPEAVLARRDDIAVRRGPAHARQPIGAALAAMPAAQKRASLDGLCRLAALDPLDAGAAAESGRRTE